MKNKPLAICGIPRQYHNSAKVMLKIPKHIADTLMTKAEAESPLEACGILVTAIRPPTVPAGTSRLRITLSAGHSNEDVERLLEALDQCQEN